MRSRPATRCCEGRSATMRPGSAARSCGSSPASRTCRTSRRMPRCPTRSRVETSRFSSSERSPAADLNKMEANALRYMLLIYGDENALDETERVQCYEESTQLTHQLDAAGQFLAASPLQPTSLATSVRVREGRRLVTDGPFAETREQLGGFFMIEAKDLDEAIAIAARIPMARRGTVEVRPVVELQGLPTTKSERG